MKQMEITTFRMAIKYKDLATLEMMANDRFKEGFTMTLNILEELLAIANTSNQDQLKKFNNQKNKNYGTYQSSH